LDPSLLLLAARVLVGGAFVVSGVRMALDQKGVTGFLTGKGVPYPAFVTLSGTAIEIVLGLAVIAGLWLPWVSLALAVFIVAATVMGHNFLREVGPARGGDINAVIANTIVVGGLLALAAASW